MTSLVVMYNSSSFTYENYEMKSLSNSSLIIAILSLLVAFFSFGYTVWSNHKFWTINALQEVQSIAIPNLARFNGILNSKLLQDQPALSNKEIETLGKTYSDVRDAYNAQRNYFSKSARKKIDEEINTLEDDFKSNPDYDTFFIKMHDIMELIEKESRL